MASSECLLLVILSLSVSSPVWAFFSYSGDPEERMNASQLITSKGYPCEEYTVKTDDGFLLGVQRIPHGRNSPDAMATRPVIFLQHGLLCSSTNWLTNLVNESFAYILADAGFDVWLGNARGNTYSRKHVSLKPDQDEFWAWSWDEMAQYDIPGMVQFALNISNQKQLYYVGHSQGTLVAFAQLSRDPEFAKKIKWMFAMGPVATVGHVTSPIRYIAGLAPEIELLFDIFGVRDFLPNSKIVKWLADHVCTEQSRIFCENILFVLSGWDPQQLNVTRLPVYFTHVPAGTSVRNIVHFAQMIESNQFQMYNYGTVRENEKYYNQTTPPLYHPEKITTPISLYWGDQDWLADPTDVKNFIPKIQKVLVNSNEIKEFDHLDFIWGMDASQLVYWKIIQAIKEQEINIHI